MKLTGRRNQCPTCGEYFKSDAGFYKHRTGTFLPNTRRCMTVEEMRSAGMVKRGDCWVSAAMPARDFSGAE